MSVFLPIPYCFDYCSFVVLFEISGYDTSSLVPLSQCCFGPLGSLWSIQILGFFFGSISVKNTIGILIGIAVPLDYFR